MAWINKISWNFLRGVGHESIDAVRLAFFMAIVTLIGVTIYKATQGIWNARDFAESFGIINATGAGGVAAKDMAIAKAKTVASHTGASV